MKKILIFLIFFFLLAGCLKKGNISNEGENFSFITVDGKHGSLKDYRGKVVIVDFMATWCFPCHMQMKELEKVHLEYGKDVIIISIDIDGRENADTIKNTFSNYINKWIFAMNSSIAYRYEIKAIPTIYIYDKKGNIAFNETGYTSFDKIKKIIDKLL